MISFLFYIAAGAVIGWTLHTVRADARRREERHLTRMRFYDRQLRRKT